MITFADPREAILHAAKNGDIESINKLLEIVQPYVDGQVKFNLSRAKWLSEIDNDVVGQVILYEIWIGVSKCKAKTWKAFIGWVSQVAYNKSIHAVEKAQAKKRGGHLERQRIYDDEVTANECSVFESMSLDDLMAKLESVASINDRHKAVFDTVIAGDSKTIDAKAVAKRLGSNTVNSAYRVIKQFRQAAAATVYRQYDPELVEAVKDDLQTNQSRRAMRNCYGLSASDLDAIAAI